MAPLSPPQQATTPPLPREQASVPLPPCEQSQPPPPPKTEEKQILPTNIASSSPAHWTRQRTRRVTAGDSEDEEEKPNLFPLREVSIALGVIGFIHTTIDTGDVRAFKKEMGKLIHWGWQKY